MILLIAVFSVSLLSSDALCKKGRKKKKADPDAPKIADTKIASAVKKFLMNDGTLDFKGVSVNVKDGVATLTGSADNLIAKGRALRLAEIVEGVTSVADQIVLKTAGGRDRKIFVSIDRVLELYPMLKPKEVDVGLLKGKAYLSGVVPSYGDVLLSEKLVSGVRGVSEVDNRMNVSGKFSGKSVIAKLIKMDPLLYGASIEIEASGGDVTLKGVVGSAAEKSLAIYYSKLAGAKSVNADALEVKWWKGEELRKAAGAPSCDDKCIVESVKKLLALDPRTKGQAVTVKSLSGRVFLGGKVDNLMTKIAAGEDALNTFGVWKVVNRMRVKEEVKMDDNELSALLQKVFESDSILGSVKFHVAVRGGTVHLNGNVANAFMKRRAENVAAMIRGVEKVNNEIDVEGRGSSKPGDALISSIKEMLKWDSLVDETDINVEIVKNDLVISGNVDSFAELRMIIADAFRAGAGRVKSAMKISGVEAYDGSTFKSPQYFEWPFGL